LASRNGRQSGNTCTAVPIFIRVVRAAMATAMVTGAASTERVGAAYSSVSHMTSSPQRSADLLERLFEGLRMADAGRAGKLMEHTEFHNFSLPTAKYSIFIN